MEQKREIIAIARLGPGGVGRVREVLEIARRTEDRRLLAVCLDCFQAVLADATDEVTREVCLFLGGRIEDDAYRAFGASC